MFRKFVCVFALIATCSALLPAAQMTAQSKGVANGYKKWWQIRYHKDEKNAASSNAVAIMLKVNADASSDTHLTGKLRLYRSTTADNAGNIIYDPAARQDVNNLDGQIDSNPGDNDDRKLQRFSLAGTYYDGDHHLHVVTVKGFHYTGKTKGKGTNKNRQDDQLVVRIKDALYSPLAKWATGNCDEEPPDEDVLTEEDVTDDGNPDDPTYEG